MIPKLVHRVWLGPHAPPAEHDYAAAWAATNPGWQLLTWTDQTVPNLFPLVTQAEYDDAPTYVHRADLILPEAVYRHGGVAVGYDIEPLRPLDTFIGGYDCWCTPDADGFAGGAFFGAEPGHRAIRHVLDTIHRRHERDGWATGWPQPHIDTGPWAWGEAFAADPNIPGYERAGKYGMVVLGDYRTAYPIRYWEKQLFDDPTKYAHLTRDSVVVHRFAGSWVGDNAANVLIRRPDVLAAPPRP